MAQHSEHNTRSKHAVGANDASVSNSEKDPSTWVTGGEPMTGAQKSYLTTLSDEAGIEPDTSLTKAEASEKIDELRKGNPRVNDQA